MILFRICSNLQVIHAVNQLCIPGWIACYTLTIPGQTLANMKQTFYWIETLVVSQSLHAGIPACSSIISDDTWYRIGSMINCLTLTCVVTIRIVDKENYKYQFTFRTKGLTSVHGQMSVRRTKTLPSSQKRYRFLTRLPHDNETFSRNLFSQFDRKLTPKPIHKWYSRHAHST